MNETNNENELINKILEIEEIAQKKMLKEKELETKNLEKLELEKQKISANMDNKAKQILEKFKTFKQKEFEKELKILTNNKNKIISDLNSTYEKNETDWIKNTVSRIVEINQETSIQ